MAAAAAAATYLSPALASSSTSSISKKHCSFSISIISSHQQQHTKWNHQLGISRFSTWNGLRHHLGIPTSQYVVKLGRKGKCKGKGVYASLFGVGAPEALVIGVVALLVFGPKGLAEVARNVGKTLRTFQPTIRELQDVSREFKSTLEREIGLDEIKDLTRPTQARPPTAVSEDPQKAVDPTEESPSSSKPYTTEEYLKVTQEQLKKQKEMESSSQSQVEPEGLLQDSSPSSSEASLTEDYAKTSKQQLEALGDLQQKEASAASLVESKDGSLAAKDAETQEYLKKLEEEVKAVIAEKQKKAASAATEIKSQVSDSQEAASVTPPSQKPESET